MIVLDAAATSGWAMPGYAFFLVSIAGLATLYGVLKLIVKSWGRPWLVYLFQVAIATVGGILTVGILADCLEMLPKVGRLISASEDAFSFVILPVVGLGIGFLVARRLRRRSAVWVWVLPVAWFLLASADTYFYPGMNYRLEQGQLVGTPAKPLRALLTELGFYGTDACADSDCLGEIVILAPLVSAIGYSLGAWLALRRTPRFRDPPDPAATPAA